ncbi:MAG TPA: hypothetical protein VGJ84_00840 [Polyangiaceae bacterium]|jgi:hypothetical protein
MLAVCCSLAESGFFIALPATGSPAKGSEPNKAAEASKATDSSGSDLFWSKRTRWQLNGLIVGASFGSIDVEKATRTTGPSAGSLWGLNVTLLYAEYSNVGLELLGLEYMVNGAERPDDVTYGGIMIAGVRYILRPSDVLAPFLGARLTYSSLQLLTANCMLSCAYQSRHPFALAGLRVETIVPIDLTLQYAPGIPMFGVQLSLHWIGVGRRPPREENRELW